MKNYSNSILFSLLLAIMFTGCVSTENHSEDSKSFAIKKLISEHISKCATGISGQLISDDLVIKVIFELDMNGNVTQIPAIIPNGGTANEQKRFGLLSHRWIRKCAPYDFLPKDKYAIWAKNEITFIPAKMFE